MDFLSYIANGDYNIPPLKGNVKHQDKTTVVVISNPDSATITFGIADDSGNFLAFADGVITSDAVINHGPGAKLMVRIGSISTNPVKIGLSV